LEIGDDALWSLFTKDNNNNNKPKERKEGRKDSQNMLDL
jgi:hypothetical protein